jgi:hypothetical protein
MTELREDSPRYANIEMKRTLSSRAYSQSGNFFPHRLRSGGALSINRFAVPSILASAKTSRNKQCAACAGRNDPCRGASGYG